VDHRPRVPSDRDGSLLDGVPVPPHQLSARQVAAFEPQVVSVANHFHREGEGVDTGGELDVGGVAVFGWQQERAPRLAGRDERDRSRRGVDTLAEPDAFDVVGGEPIVVTGSVGPIGEVAGYHVGRFAEPSGPDGTGGGGRASEARRPQARGIGGVDHTLRPGRGSLDEGAAVEVGAGDRRGRVGEVEPVGPQTAILPHCQHARTPGFEVKCLIDAGHEVDRGGARSERVCSRRERADDVDDHDRADDAVEFRSVELSTHHRMMVYPIDRARRGRTRRPSTFADVTDHSQPLTWRVGDVLVTRVEDRVVHVPREQILPAITDEQIARQRPWIDPYFDTDGNVLLSFHALVVESLGTTIVVDTCMGTMEPRPVRGDPNFPDRLADTVGDAGLAAVDIVLCTHLHWDHVGWNTRLVDGEWRPTFPKARYLIGAREFDFFDDGNDTHGVGDQSVAPLLEAGLVDLIDTDHAITTEVRTMPTPGHTPGHIAVLIESQGRTAIITGDAFHTPLQFTHPEIAATPFDWDTSMSSDTRRTLIADHCDDTTLVVGTHFAPPTAGLIRSSDSCTWFDA
jgi:glyoxylase-like metal-dependent hydrolase (beta-lactamase superfamily II)